MGGSGQGLIIDWIIHAGRQTQQAEQLDLLSQVKPYEVAFNLMNKRPGYSSEVRERAVRLVLTSERDHKPRWAAIKSVAAKLAVPLSGHMTSNTSRGPMNRIMSILIGVVLPVLPFIVSAGEIALTFDDAPTPDSALMSGADRTRKLISGLKAADVADVLFFVKADAIDHQSATRLKQYAAAGFHLANHSFSHRSANQVSVEDYALDAYRAHLKLKEFGNILNFHRFPYLHYGKDMADINRLQMLLGEMEYRDGYVTVDNYDWYINALLVEAAGKKADINYEKARDFYVKTLYESVVFYDDIARKSLGRSPRHVLLLHENDAAALFIGDLVNHLRSNGWTIISPQQAYQDPIARDFPQVTFHKQGRVAAIGHSKGMPESDLRHASENEQYLDKAFVEAGIVRRGEFSK